MQSDRSINVTFYGHVPYVSTGGRIVNATRVAIMVGQYGPFQKDFAPGEDSPEAINAWKQQQAHQVSIIAGG